MTGESIHFTTYDGLKLVGTLYSAGEKRPCVIMTQGFSGLKEHFLPDFAARFNGAGYTVLIYDNRNWGESAGTPRNEVDPVLQTRDYYDAFNYAAGLPSVDATKIVYWGSSMSGGNVLVAAAVNKSVRGVICQVPFVSSEGGMAGAAAALCETILQDRARGVDSNARWEKTTPLMAPVFPASRDEVLAGTSQAILKDISAITFFEEMERRGLRREKMVTLQSLWHGVGHEPAAWVRRVAPRPLLMVVAAQDTTCPVETQLAVFNKALHPKTLHILKGACHFDPYYGAAFEENIQVQLDFLKEVFE